MAEKNVVRQDVVQISWDVQKSPFDKVTKETNKFQSTVSKAVGTGESKFNKLNKSIDLTQKKLSKMRLSDKMQSDIDLANRAIDKMKTTVRNVQAEFAKLKVQATLAVGAIQTLAKQNLQKVVNGFRAIKTAIVNIGPNTKKFVNSLKTAAKQKLTNTVNELQRIKNTLTGGQTGVKGFTTALKNIGKISFAKVIKGAVNVKNGFVNAKNTIVNFGSSVKNAFNRGVTGAKNFLTTVKTIGKQNLNKLSSSVDKVTKKIGGGLVSAARKAGQAIKTFAIAGLGALGAGAGAGVNYNAQMETYQTSFEVMTGSAKKAQETVSKLQKMGAATPFEMTDLADTTQLLMNYGFTADDAINRMSMLGDIAQGNADKMNSIATAYGQMSSAGKVSLEDVKQMIEAGFNPLQEISNHTGESMASLYERISKGKISVDEITASMQRSTSEGGKYFQSMEKQSKTFSGQVSTMKDNFNQLLGTMTSGLTDKLATTVLPKINNFIGELGTAFEKGGFSAVFDKLTQKMGPLGTALQNVVGKVKEFVGNKEKMQILKDIFSSIKTAVGNIAPILGKVVSGVWDFVTSTGVLKGVKTIFDGISKAIGWVKDNFEVVKEVVIAVGGAFLIFGGAVKVVSIAVGAYNAIMKVVKTVQVIAAASQMGFNAALLACPVSWIVAAIVGLIAVIILLVRNWDKVKEAGAKCWNKIKEVWGGVKDWFNSKVVQPVKKFFVDLWDKLPSPVKGVCEKIFNAFKWAYDKITGAWGGIKDFFSGIWKDAVKAVAKPVNKIIGGANWVLEKLGSEKRFSEWQPYARGTNGHPGGNAIVNDGRGAELVQMPNGRTFIPSGKNVMLPNAPKGMKVLDAQRTAQLMGKSGPTFHYEEGTGWDIWSFFDDAKGLVGKVIDKFISYKGMAGFALDVGKAMISNATTAMSSWISGLFDSMGGKSLASYEASKGVEQWRSTVAQALKMEGLYSADNVKRTLYQMQTESGGNPKAINNWDSNAKKGTPSKGLMQVIDPTFKSYARSGYNKNIYDPLSNILASVRYARSRYGSLAKAYRGVGYESGIGFPQMRLPSYSPASSVPVTNTSNSTNNNYNPSFNLTMHGTVDRTTERTIKQWVMEALEETFEGIRRSNPRVTEV